MLVLANRLPAGYRRRCGMSAEVAACAEALLASKAGWPAWAPRPAPGRFTPGPMRANLSQVMTRDAYASRAARLADALRALFATIACLVTSPKPARAANFSFVPLPAAHLAPRRKQPWTTLERLIHLSPLNQGMLINPIPQHDAGVPDARNGDRRGWWRWGGSGAGRLQG